MRLNVQPPQILGAFKFLRPSEVYEREKLYTLGYNPPDGLNRTNIVLDERKNIPIKDMRKVHQTFLWESSGIAVKTISPVLAEDEFDDAEMIKKIFYPEIERVLQKAFGPSKILVLEHVVCRGSVTVVHADENNSLGNEMLCFLFRQEGTTIFGSQRLLCTSVSTFHVLKPKRWLSLR